MIIAALIMAFPIIAAVIQTLFDLNGVGVALPFGLLMTYTIACWLITVLALSAYGLADLINKEGDPT